MPTWSARDVFDATTTWAEIDALDLVVPAAVQNEMFLAVRRLVERAARWLVHHADDLALGPTVDRFRPGVQAVVAALPDARRCGAGGRDSRPAGVPRELARRVAVSEAALAALPAVALAARRGVDPLTVARTAVRARRPPRARTACVSDIAALPRGDRWQTEARAALRDDFYESTARAHRGGARARPTPTGTPADAGRRLAGRPRVPAVERYRSLVDDVERAGVFDLATLAVVRRALRELAALD